MNSSVLASGDNNNPHSDSSRLGTLQPSDEFDTGVMSTTENGDDFNKLETKENITSQLIEDNEVKLKERIEQCKNIIESLKLQLNEEKEKLKNETTAQQALETPKCASVLHHEALEKYGNTSMYSACVENKLYCDEGLIEYEKQLQKYQNTLNMAQNEKKNAIRKQMLAKAFKLKLMEVENQCNIELLRVKQNLQCLEPLEMIANKWKTSNDENLYDANNYEFIPNFLELNANSTSDVNACKDEFDTKFNLELGENFSKNYSSRSN